MGDRRRRQDSSPVSTWEATVEGSFRARHALPYPDGSREAPHEHLWQVSVSFRSDSLDEAMGVVIDFVAAEQALRELGASVDGADLNELAAFSDGRPSAERVAQWIAEKLQGTLACEGRLYRVAVIEAPGCSAAYYPHGP